MKIFLADDDPLLRAGLRVTLAQDQDIEIIGEASDGLSAVKKTRNCPRPDISLIDLYMPGLSGIEVIRILRKNIPGMKIIMLSSYDDEGNIRDALEAGADGYVMKYADNAELLRIIKSVYKGCRVISPYLFVSNFHQPLTTDNKQLTPPQKSPKRVI